MNGLWIKSMAKRFFEFLIDWCFSIFERDIASWLSLVENT